MLEIYTGIAWFSLRLHGFLVKVFMLYDVSFSHNAVGCMYRSAITHSENLEPPSGTAIISVRGQLLLRDHVYFRRGISGCSVLSYIPYVVSSCTIGLLSNSYVRFLLFLAFQRRGPPLPTLPSLTAAHRHKMSESSPVSREHITACILSFLSQSEPAMACVLVHKHISFARLPGMFALVMRRNRFLKYRDIWMDSPRAYFHYGCALRCVASDSQRGRVRAAIAWSG